jgi:hypothetical protein
MLKSLATRDDAIEIGKQMQQHLPILAKDHAPTGSGRLGYTKAIWHYFDKLRTANDWGFSPKTCPTGGKAKGEYLTDFALYDDKIGNRIACESEWEGIQKIQWAFDKLKGVKGDLKILVFQEGFTADGTLPANVDDLLRQGLANSGHHHPGHEFYLFIQFDREQSRLYLWEPLSSEPLNVSEIRIDRVM